jgi:hypothetical protein
MTKQAFLRAVAAGALTLTALVTAAPASAGHSCWLWSYRLGQWVNYCRTYTYHVYHHYVYHYPYYEPYGNDYGPYYNYGPSIGFGFSFGGGHHENDDNE